MFIGCKVNDLIIEAISRVHTEIVYLSQSVSSNSVDVLTSHVIFTPAPLLSVESLFSLHNFLVRHSRCFGVFGLLNAAYYWTPRWGELLQSLSLHAVLHNSPWPLILQHPFLDHLRFLCTTIWRCFPGFLSRLFFRPQDFLFDCPWSELWLILSLISERHRQ